MGPFSGRAQEGIGRNSDWPGRPGASVDDISASSVPVRVPPAPVLMHWRGPRPGDLRVHAADLLKFDVLRWEAFFDPGEYVIERRLQCIWSAMLFKVGKDLFI